MVPGPEGRAHRDTAHRRAAPGAGRTGLAVRAAIRDEGAVLHPMMAGPCHESYLLLSTKSGVFTCCAASWPKKHFHRSPGGNDAAQAALAEPLEFQAV